MENNSNYVEKIFYLDGGLDKENKKKLYQISEKYNVCIEFIDVEAIENYLRENGIPQYKGSYATYYKLFALNFIRCSTENILYIDADTIIEKGIQGLIHFDFKGCPLAMVYDALHLRYKKKIGMHSKKYYNGGIVLFNVKKWLDGCQERVMHHIQTNNAVYAVVDQDILNVVFEGEIALLPNKYNYTTLNIQFSYKNLCSIFQLKNDYYYSEEEVIKCKKDAVIYHALGYFGVQTWNADGTHPFDKRWDKYLKISPWGDYVKSNAQLTAINRWQRLLYNILPHFLYNPLHRVAVDVSLQQRTKKFKQK